MPQQAQQASFPPMQQSDAVRYQSMFQQMDNDRDGFVQVGVVATSSCSMCITVAYVLSASSNGRPLHSLYPDVACTATSALLLNIGTYATL